MKHFFRIFLMGGLALGLLGSCQTTREVHYFKSGPNYYRLKIKEYAFLSSSRYLSGYFDEAALDKYFGEISPSDTAKSIVAISQEDQSCDSTTKKLVLVLSTNSDAVVGQISAFAENEQVLQTIADIANKGQVEEKERLKVELKGAENNIESIMELGDDVKSILEDANANEEYKKATIENYLKSLKK